MTPQELKNSILQLAIQGKLVEQRPEEGSAKDLIEKLQSAKEMLIAQKWIKKEKKSDYEPEPFPFDLPDTWWLARVGDCISNKSGLAYDKNNLAIKGQTMVRVLRGGNIIDMGFLLKEDDIRISNEFVKPDLYLRKNMLITPAVTSLDHVGKMGRIDRDYADVVVGGFVLMLTPHISDDTFSKYLLYIFSSKYFRDCCRKIVNKSGQAFYNLSREKMMQIYIPIPPLVEQKRIVAKIEELLPYIDRYEKAWSRLEDFKKRFPVDMQKSILQMAIQGKLVEQRPEEGNGEELYQQIQVEKQKLVNAGKIKKEKPLPEISEDEIPFDIPESWKWCRLSDIVLLENGDRSSKYPVDTDYVEFGIPFFGAKDMVGQYMSFENVRYISETKFAELGNGKLKDSDFICLLRGSVGKTALFRADAEHYTGFICAQMVIVRSINREIVDFLYKIMTSPYYFGYVESKTTGTAVRQLPAKELGKLYVPLPPLAEQKRIVAKLEEILPLCEKLK
ncbi:MAG: restriction endonuclease subunit S [Lachnospiraceae bacterium]